ncbi:hypothetical protein M0R45_011551 [Rubus argutus]|uniref:Late embryogenesis abundant protein LEA-2 subgroup domain-containing protein n=1 Tax=Rubus argutus TaxID=59490 RepID=A0AAW1YAD7_RUBAR
MASAAAHSDRRKCVFADIIILIMIAIFVAGVIVLALIHSFVPYTAKFGVTDASLTQYNFTNNSSITLHYDLDLNITVRNRNRMYGIFYDNLQIMVYYQKNHHMLGTLNLTSFYQGKKNTTHLTLSLKLGQLRLDHVLSNNDGAITYHDIDIELHVRNSYKAKFTLKRNSDITCHLEVPLISHTSDNRSQSANTNTNTSNFQTTDRCYYSAGENNFGLLQIFFILGLACVLVLILALLTFSSHSMVKWRFRLKGESYSRSIHPAHHVICAIHTV